MGLIDTVKNAAEDVGDAVGDVVEAVGEAVDDALDAIGNFVEGIFQFPIIGRLAAKVWNAVTHYGWFVVGGVAELVVGAFGQPTKHLRVCVVILRDHDGDPVAPPHAVNTALANAQTIFRDEANVELDLAASSIAEEEAPEGALSVRCDVGGLIDDLGTVGSYYSLASREYCGESGFSRLVGLGSPVVTFVVRDVQGAAGCSFGHFTDYVTIQSETTGTGGTGMTAAATITVDGRTLAHELAHSCGLFHANGPDNLLNPNSSGTQMTDAQVWQFRSSPHVTYW